MIYLYAISMEKIFVFWFECYWNVHPGSQLTITQNWFGECLVVFSAKKNMTWNNKDEVNMYICLYVTGPNLVDTDDRNPITGKDGNGLIHSVRFIWGRLKIYAAGPLRSNLLCFATHFEQFPPSAKSCATVLEIVLEARSGLTALSYRMPVEIWLITLSFKGSAVAWAVIFFS